MSEFTQFEATVPVVTPAKDAETYDKYWLKQLTVNASNVDKVVLRAVFVPCKDVIDEYTEVSKKVLMENGPQKVLVIKDLFNLVDTNAEFASVMDGVFAALKAMATAQELL